MSKNSSIETVLVPSNSFAADKVTAQKAHEAGLTMTGRFSDAGTFALWLLINDGRGEEVARKVANSVQAECGAMFSDSKLEDWKNGKKGMTFATKGEKSKENPETPATRLAALAVSAKKLAEIGVLPNFCIADVEGLQAWCEKLAAKEEPKA